MVNNNNIFFQTGPEFNEVERAVLSLDSEPVQVVSDDVVVGQVLCGSNSCHCRTSKYIRPN